MRCRRCSLVVCCSSGWSGRDTCRLNLLLFSAPSKLLTTLALGFVASLKAGYRFLFPSAHSRSWARRLYRYLAYAGWTYECPICGGRFRRMLPGGLDVPVLAEKQVTGGGI